MAGGNVFAVTFHCMVEGDTHCQQHYMTGRKRVQSDSSLSDFFCTIFMQNNISIKAAGYVKKKEKKKNIASIFTDIAI